MTPIQSEFLLNQQDQQKGAVIPSQSTFFAASVRISKLGEATLFVYQPGAISVGRSRLPRGEGALTRFNSEHIIPAAMPCLHSTKSRQQYHKMDDSRREKR